MESQEMYWQCEKCRKDSKTNTSIVNDDTDTNETLQSSNLNDIGVMLNKFYKNLPLKVWISEDAIRITARIQYDSSTNQIVGVVQKPNSLTGFPDTFSYPAESASQIKNFITSNHVSSLSYVNMAQPFNLNAPSFCLPIYGKDNKLTGDDVLLRWRTILKEAEDVGIEVLGVSSDGDSCLLKSISITSKLPHAILD
ncbi:hypothetical protein FQA39_LY11773 [Lamprigera yunnana]|nr:hypothetical protein FQA39_LY11773 [Lamprigera yunnana]